MYISKPELTSQNGDLKLCVHVQSSEKTETLWYSLKKEYANLVSDCSDAPLTALLIPAMIRGEDIHIEGTISEKLYFNLSGPLQKVLKLVIPSLHLIKIFPGDVQPARQSGTGVAMGFSAGIDSFCALANHFNTNVPKGFQVTHLLFSNVGSQGHGEHGRRLFHECYAHLRPTTDQIGLPFIAIDSNMDSFYKELDFQQTHTLRNASIALLLQRGIKKFLYASSYDYSKAFVGPSYAIAVSETIILPLLSTEALDMISADSEYTRIEKTLQVGEIKDSYKSLTVCVKGYKNCSSCFKCRRTMLTLEIAGLLDRYGDVFDLNIYRKYREVYIAEVMISNDPMLQDIASYIKSSGFKIPLTSRLFVMIAKIPYLRKMRKKYYKNQ